jgi:hypothetical protein
MIIVLNFNLKNEMMKKLMFVFILFCSCASMRPVCHLSNQWLIVLDYRKSVKVWTVESIDHRCYGSFRTADIIHIGDTIKVEYLTIGSVAEFIPPIIHVIEKK